MNKGLLFGYEDILNICIHLASTSMIEALQHIAIEERVIGSIPIFRGLIYAFTFSFEKQGKRVFCSFF